MRKKGVRRSSRNREKGVCTWKRKRLRKIEEREINKDFNFQSSWYIFFLFYDEASANSSLPLFQKQLSKTKVEEENHICCCQLFPRKRLTLRQPRGKSSAKDILQNAIGNCQRKPCMDKKKRQRKSDGWVTATRKKSVSLSILFQAFGPNIWRSKGTRQRRGIDISV